ncbi:MAG TPA: tyrosine/phenylalanine carboxypeptidase domain-containing protein [Acidimicrobiia bacterium]|nr:tyrosine/phenylalanine carboxypeptidase domain-containing protein [Acidimicrobiia bacterium]
MSVTREDLAIDRELAEICGSIPFLRLVTPVNVAEQRAAFAEGATEPVFEYRPAPDLRPIAERLRCVDPERAADPVVRHLAANKKRELEIRLELIATRGTDRFFLASVELFGHVEPASLDLAMDLLTVPEATPSDRVTVSADEFAAAANREIEEYRAVYPELSARVIVSDTASGVMVENGDVYVGTDTRLALDRVEHLLHHEVGVHVLTYANGCAQPLHLLAAGLAGYDENQEALGVLAEHLSGGLPVSRLHVLAHRVVAAHLRSEQATFVETVDRLIELGAGPRSAFTTAMRAYRAGGMTKDAVYLRGLTRLCEHLATGAGLERLLVGKTTLEDDALIGDLLERGVLSPPPLRPRFLDTDTSRQRLEELRSGTTVRQIGGLAA